MINEQDFYVTYDENNLITSCGYHKEWDVQNETTICWNCKEVFTKQRKDEGYGYHCSYCNQSLRNHPIYGDHSI